MKECGEVICVDQGRGRIQELSFLCEVREILPGRELL
ncbi:hypothetical protein COLO4_37486 [Corchorus olitorius]|uniref:Uncharacterized protein n=1 Tax=Corchorus olitorius TaxID=93759 RepID=A0A1R3G196_9ROSI|nr:hypothetical protein COLO4_37486 [Corchorus olitorius]